MWAEYIPESEQLIVLKQPTFGIVLLCWIVLQMVLEGMKSRLDKRKPKGSRYTKVYWTCENCGNDRWKVLEVEEQLEELVLEHNSFICECTECQMRETIEMED